MTTPSVYQFEDIDSRLAAVIYLTKEGVPFRLCADMTVEAATTDEQHQALQRQFELFCVVQEGGSSVEIYLGAEMSEEAAQGLRASYAEASYRSGDVVRIAGPVAAMAEQFLAAAEDILKSSLEFSYPED